MTPDFPIRLRPACMWRKLQLANPPSFSMWRKLQLANASSVRGFTLVELLLVIGIIGLLAAISVPVVMQSLTKARNAAIKAEIDMLHMAIMNYKNEYGSFPPCYVPTINGSDPASKHLRRLFPRLAVADISLQLAALGYRNTGPGTFQEVTAINRENALTLWLMGYNTNSQYPILKTTGSVNLAANVWTVTGDVSDRKKLYDFDTSRLTADFRYHPQGKPESPYIYIDSAAYSTAGGEPIPDSPSTFFNPDTFQIICAGRDGILGGAGADDDLSNFWPGTRGEYLDSLEN